MSESYEDLRGGTEGKIRYRPQRLRPRRTFQSMPGLDVNGAPARLVDFSINGILYRIAEGAPVPMPGERLAVSIHFEGMEAFRSAAEVVRVDLTEHGSRVACRLLDGTISLPALRQTHDTARFEASLGRSIDVYAAVPEAYQRVCQRFALFFDHWRCLLDGREREIRAQGGADVEQRLLDTERRAEPLIREDWRALRLEANDVTRDLGPEHPGFAAARRYTRVIFADALELSPYFARTFTKPRGYPGDFVAMHWMYEGVRRGDSIYARLLDQLGLEERLASTVGSRKDFMVRQLTEICARTPGTVRILTLGAGPARELQEFLATAPRSQSLEITLVDQDEEALEFAHDRLAPLTLHREGRVDLNCWNLSFQQVLDDSKLAALFPAQHMIYASGLMDYLGDAAAQHLIDGYYERVAPGGRLVVGNAADARDARWLPEFVLDWTMVYRTPEQMAALIGSRCGRVQQDDSGCWHFLTIDRPASR